MEDASMYLLPNEGSGIFTEYMLIVACYFCLFVMSWMIASLMDRLRPFLFGTPIDDAKAAEKFFQKGC
jgi:hypothetical protein